MQTPPPTPESPCPKRIASYLLQDHLNDYNPRARRSLTEIFELVNYYDDLMLKIKAEHIEAIRFKDDKMEILIKEE